MFLLSVPKRMLTPRRFVSSLFLSASMLAFPVLAHAASFYVTPGSSGVNGTFTVSVRESSGGDPINAVQASLSYSSDKLDFVSVGGGGPFNVVAQSTGGGGTVQIGKGIIGNGVTGDQFVGSVTFRVKPGANGTASVGFIGGSSIVRGTDQANVYSGGSGGTYTIGESSSSSPQKTQSTPTPTAEPVAQITDVKAANIATNSATISWTTDIPADSTAEYGLTPNYGLTTTDDTLTTNHSVTLSSSLLIPGTTYHYRVLSKSSKTADAAASQDSTFTTKGFTISLTILDANNMPVANKTVTLVTPNGTFKVTTDSNGVATFEDVPSGEQTAIADSGEQYSLTVKETDQPQKFVMHVAAASKIKIPAWAVAIIAIITGAFLIISPIRRQLRKRAKKPMGGSVTPSVPPTPMSMSTPTNAPSDSSADTQATPIDQAPPTTQ